MHTYPDVSFYINFILANFCHKQGTPYNSDKIPGAKKV